MIEKITPEFLESIGIFELREIAREIGVYSPTTLKRNILIDKILDIYEGRTKPITKTNRGRPVKTSGKTKDIVDSVKTQAELNYEFNGIDKSKLLIREPIKSFEAIAADDGQQCAGILDITVDGYGIIKVKNYSGSELDAYLPENLIVTYRLRTGDLIQGMVDNGSGKNISAMHTILAINDIPVDEVGLREHFDNLTPIYSNEKIISFDKNSNKNTNLLSLIAPIGKGQRAIVFAPDKYIKIEFMTNIVDNIVTNNKDIEMLLLLIGELPEEVTEFKRSIKSGIVHTTFDELPQNHIKTAELVLQRAKRLTELGKDVVVLIDNLNTLARAYYSKEHKDSGTLEQHSFYFIKRLLGAARNTEEGGSLSILACTNSNTEVMFDTLMCKDLKNIGNCEIYLSDYESGIKLDVANSDTSRKELLLNDIELACSKAIKESFKKDCNKTLDKIVPKLNTSAEEILNTIKKDS